MKLLFNIILLSFFSLNSLAQIDSKHEIGLGIGGLNVKNDLTDKFSYEYFKSAYTVFYKKNLNNSYHTSLRTALSVGALYASDLGDDPFQRKRGDSFTGTLFDLSSQIEYNFFNFRKTERDIWSPYFVGGIGLTKVFYNGIINHNDRLLRKVRFNIPFGIGAKFAFGDKLTLAAEFHARKLFTDNFENIVAEDPNDKFQQHNTQNNDMFYMASLTLSYRFIKVVCAR